MRTIIELDDDLVAEVMRRYGLSSKRAAVDLALRRLVGDPMSRAVRDLLSGQGAIHTTDVVLMEVLAGGRDDNHTRNLRRLVMRSEFVPVDGLADFEQAAALYRACRRAGETVRAMNDCLIAAVAMGAEVDLLQADRDFDVITRHSALRLYGEGLST